MPPRRFRNKRRHKRRKMPIVKLIKKVIKSSAEHKFKSLLGSTASLVESTAFSTILTNVAQGTARNERIGNNISLAKLRIRYSFNLLSAGAVNTCRMYVFQQIDEGLPEDLPGVFDLWPPLDKALHRYRILADKTFEMGLGVHQELVREITIPGSKLVDASYQGSGSELLGVIRLQFETSNNTADTVSVNFDSRLYWTDV